MSKIKLIFTIIFHVICGAVYIMLTHFYYNDYEKTCILFYYHHQIRSIANFPLFRVGHETVVVKAVCHFIFLTGRCQCIVADILHLRVYNIYKLMTPTLTLNVFIWAIICHFTQKKIYDTLYIYMIKNPDRHCSIWITWLIGRTEVDLDCSLQALEDIVHMTGQHPTTMPVFSQWQHAAHMPPN